MSFWCYHGEKTVLMGFETFVEENRIVAIIEARMASTRLPGKVLLTAAGKTMLSHLILRLRKVTGISGIVIATSLESDDEKIALVAEAEGVGVFRGDHLDVLKRVANAAKAFDASSVLEITADCPVIDPSIVQRVVDEYIGGDFDLVSNGVVRSYPDGMDAAVVSLSALQRADVEASDPLDREHVLRYIYKRPEVFSIKHVRAPEHLHWPELGLTLDEPADYAFLNAIIEELYPVDEAFGCEEVVNFLHDRPGLMAINSSVPRKGDS